MYTVLELRYYSYRKSIRLAKTRLFRIDFISFYLKLEFIPEVSIYTLIEMHKITELWIQDKLDSRRW